jgi:methionyl-tRNA formyltransferase
VFHLRVLRLPLPSQVRGFAGWPGTKATFAVENKQGGEDMVTVKVVLTRLAAGPRKEGATDRSVTFVGKKALQVACDDGSLIEVRP